MIESGRANARLKGRQGEGEKGRIDPQIRWSIILLLALTHFQTGCGVYSFTGASIPEHLRTVAVPLADVRAQGVAVDLDRQLTDALIERFADRTRLSLEPDEETADAIIRATIQRYSITPVAVTGDEVASLNRVTLVVDILYRDAVEDEDRLSRSFTASADYDPGEGAAGEAAAAMLALEQLAGDVFTAATSDW